MSNTYFRYSLMPKEFYKILRDEKTRKKRFLQVCKSILQTNYPNLSDIQVAWASKDMASKNTLGFFDISKNTMFINPTYLKIYNEMAIKENPCFVYHIFDTIVHEGRHAEQAYNAKIFKQNIKKFEKLDYKSQYIALIMRLHENCFKW